MSKFKLQALSNKQTDWTIHEFAYIGRDPHSTICIENPNVERRHALIEIRQNRLYIKDLKTVSGVYVNDVQILEAQLQDGDIIRIGEVEFRLHDLDAVQTEFPCHSLNEAWSQKLKRLAGAAQSKYPVLLLGPSGTGKDVLAQALHQCSDRKNYPFLSVNCSALTETLIESELFGHVKGSFTGAVQDRKGAFEAARGGTLFLDEIGDLPYGLQAKLLRALENNEIRPVGSDRAIKTDVRITAATHQNLIEKIQQGSFRADLYYRLNVITVQVPSLKERMEDFETLLYDFARQMRVRFSHQAILDLKKHDWPGNIRELKNMVARASALYPKHNITPEYLNELLQKEIGVRDGAPASMGTQGQLPQLSVIKEIERQMIIKRLTANQGNQKRTATDLGMPKSTLHDRIKSYKIDPCEFTSSNYTQ